MRSVSRASSSAAKKRQLKRVESHNHQSVVERSTASRDNRLRETALMRHLKSGGDPHGALVSAGKGLVASADFFASSADYPKSPGGSTTYGESLFDPRATSIGNASVVGGNRALTASPASGIAPLPSTANSVVRYSAEVAKEPELTWRLDLQVSAHTLGTKDVRSGLLAEANESCYVPRMEKGEVLKSMKENGGEGISSSPAVSVGHSP